MPSASPHPSPIATLPATTLIRAAARERGFARMTISTS
jgi:hypothetical protein